MPRQGGRARRLVPVVLGLLVLGALVLVLPLGCHGHVVRAAHAPNHGRDFDFARPECEPAARPPASGEDLIVRYLGVGGLWIERGGDAVLTAPFFSRYGLGKVIMGKVAWDDEAIERGMDGLPTEALRGVLVGHSHYDHVADLPPLLRRYAPTVPVLANWSAVTMLEDCDGLDNRFVDLDHAERDSYVLDGADGKPGRVRITPLVSSHAPHARWIHFGEGDVKGDWDCIEGRKLRKMKEGKTYAFLIDFLGEDGRTIDFRIHYQDAASDAPDGFPPREVVAEREVDLAVLCMPSSWLVDDYPEKLLKHVRARHALVTHYEDFFRPTEKRLRFVATLTDRRADGFLSRVGEAMTDPARPLRGPHPSPCGPSSDAATMPLPGEWLRFPARSGGG